MSSRYQVIVKRSAAKAIRRLPRQAQRRLYDAMRSLGDDPRPDGCQKVVGLSHGYRLRVGEYRIVYVVSDREITVTVTRAAHRKDAYRRAA